MKKEILKQLRSDYNKLEIKPSEELWSKIESGLESQTDIAPQKTSFRWWKYAAAVAFLIFMIPFYYYENHPADKKTSYKKTVQDHVAPSQWTAKKLDVQNVQISEATEKIAVEKSPDATKENASLTIPSEKIKNDLPVIVKRDEQIKNEDISKNDITKTIIPQISLAEHKKVNYTNADQLLMGRELEKTREENNTDQMKFGTLDMSKIKIKRPGSLKILGFTIYSDSLETR
ncbi:hypothetical protein N0B16_04955 [Chryseobacterium sp. GMJ5]|uniref:Anti-sigma factor n=1 Tax=Chryseobacterium gilvum TaxID=2976534 RepID=A0ABT2VUU7_9FLAO|nr:hypothetical protein [Chryseobacterium gilvum]MCU7613780.1 hypothetical protein [Chryseobacterium gilvum]